MIGRHAWQVVKPSAASRFGAAVCAGSLGKRFFAANPDPRNICDKIAFIGAGNMAKAIMGTLSKNARVPCSRRERDCNSLASTRQGA
jgi:hypothetical protein